MKSKLLLIGLIVLTLPQLTMSQSLNFNPIGAGARARGMGGAFIGVADDATAASWNPAGLVQLESAEASVVGLFESYTPESDIPDFDADPYKSSHIGLNFFSVAFPLAIGERNLVAAVAYQKVMDLYYKYDSDYAEVERTGGVNSITPSIGIQLTTAISIGASVNILTGSTEYTQKYKTGYSQDTETSYDYTGTNFSVGGLFDFNRFKLGVVYKSPFGLNEKDDDQDYDVTLTMPQMLGVGVSFAATENLTLAADYEMRSFSDTEYEDNRTEQKTSAEWEDINQLRVGVEYLLMTGDNVLPLRLGFATTPLPTTDDNDDQIVGKNITAGVGLIMGNINLDLGVEYNSYSYEFDTGEQKYDYSDNYLRFIMSGVFHFGQ